MIVEGKTSSGFAYKIDERQRKDRKILGLMVNIMKPEDEIQQTCAVYALPEALLGQEQAKALEDHIRSINDGYCEVDALNDELMEIIKGEKDLKN